ncbi:hypothetical protein V6N12_074936 [Hibiscus sabdariffa]|uniref:Uncharacterized protein n=1 Tax=Hibiscus sabdariffa TaxID=183260 RepID=A0ABR2AW28_9ROSI
MKEDWLGKATDVVKVLDERLMRNDAVEMNEVKLPKAGQNYVRNLIAKSLQKDINTSSGGSYTMSTNANPPVSLSATSSGGFRQAQ